MTVWCYLTDKGDSVMTASTCWPPHEVVLYPFGGLDPSIEEHVVGIQYEDTWRK